MTVNTTTGIINYQADGATTQWTFPFPAINTTFIQVFVTSSTGAVVQQAPNTYTVILNPPVDPNPTSIGGTVTFPLTGIPLAVGNQLTISRSLPVVQSTSISGQSVIYPPVIEQEFDYLTLLDQGSSQVLARAFQVGPQDPIPAVVPPVAQRANQQAFFDTNGNLTGGGIPAGGVFISSVMIPVVEASTLQSARDSMGVTAAIAAAIASLYSTGDLKATHKTVADPGWIIWSDGTIGNTGSGSSIFADPSTQALFTLYYNSYSDALCPLKTSANANTTRAAQGTAAAAFAANCRMTLPLGAGRALAMAGTGGGLTARTLGSNTGLETTNPSTTTMAVHTHGITDPANNATAPLVQYNPNANMTFSGTAGVGVATVVNAGGGQPSNNMQPTTFVNIMVKL